MESYVDSLSAACQQADWRSGFHHTDLFFTWQTLILTLLWFSVCQYSCISAMCTQSVSVNWTVQILCWMCNMSFSLIQFCKIFYICHHSYADTLCALLIFKEEIWRLYFLLLLCFFFFIFLFLFCHDIPCGHGCSKTEGMDSEMESELWSDRWVTSIDI